MALQRGQVLREARSSFQAAARRLLVFDFDVFFLGTAILVLENCGADGGQREMRRRRGAEPPGTGVRHCDGAVLVPDTSARRDDATRVGVPFETQPV